MYHRIMHTVEPLQTPHQCGTHLRFDKPPFLPAASVAGLEDVGRVDGDAMVGVVQRGKVVPVKVKSLEIRSVTVSN